MGALFPFLFGTCCDESYDVSIKQRFVLYVICTKLCTQQNDQTLSHKVTCFHFLHYLTVFNKSSCVSADKVVSLVYTNTHTHTQFFLTRVAVSSVLTR